MERIDTRDMQAALFMSFSPQITTSSVNLFMTPTRGDTITLPTGEDCRTKSLELEIIY